jgi:HAE1 family hydrophobic/amphiphilic exporter-1
MAGANPSQGIIGSPVLLKEVARIKLLEGRPTSIVNLNGEPTLGVYIYKENRYNTVEVVKSVLTVVDAFKSNNPGIRMHTIENQGEFIEASVGEVRDSALIGIFFAVVVLFLFLRNWGATLVVSLAIPLSVIATFNLMYFNGLTLNLMTLGGLALGAGMLVDNAIVVLENIFRFTEKGEPPNEAAVKGAGGVGGAIVASTLTTIVVFLPIVYLQGVSGELFKDQAWTVAFSLFCSLLVALLVIPLLSTKLLKRRRRAQQSLSSSAGSYKNILAKALKNKGWVLILTLVLTAGSYALLPSIGSSFLPSASANELALEVTLPAGTNLQRTHETLASMDQSIRRLIPEESLDWIYTHAGPSVSESGGSFSKGENEGTLRMAFKQTSGVVLREVVEQLNRLFSEVPGLEIRYAQTEPALAALTGDQEAPLIMEVRGSDMEVLQSATSQISHLMKEMPQLVNVYTSFEEEAPEVDIRIDRLKAGMFGLDIQSIITQVKAALQEQDAGSIEESGNRTEIKVVTSRLNVKDLKNLNIIQGSKNYRLSELAEVVVGREPGQILRDNQSRVGKVYADINGNQPFDQMVQEVKASVGQLGLPPGYRVVISGDEQRRKESFSQLSFALILSIVLVYMVMASQFESLIHPFTVLLTIPLAGVGTVLAFWLMGLTFNIMAFIGVVMLGGIAVNNSIILVDAINQYKEEGLNLREAVLSAAANRFRPILMTSITTILALLPLAVSFGRSSSLRAPMAIAVIAGLLSSTLLTLVVIPCVYELFDRSERNRGGLK